MARAKPEAPAPETLDEALVATGTDKAPVQVEAAAPAPEAANGPRLVRARVLVQCDLGAPNDVIEIEADQVELAGDVIDTSPAAVAYAESLKG